jgi:heme exporter protein C
MKIFQPKFFVKMSRHILPWSIGLMLLCLTWGYIWALGFAPSDVQQGSVVKVMYIHVPCAWFSMLCYAMMALMSTLYLILRLPLCYLLARSLGAAGISFTIVCLITGSLWGIPTWGTWWVWDARLTSVLILLFLYLGFFGLGQAFTTPERSAKSAAIIALVGVVNLPIIKWSVEWWYTLHQPASVMKLSAPSIHHSMLIPLIICAFGWFFYVTSIVIMRTRSALQRRLNMRPAP